MQQNFPQSPPFQQGFAGNSQGPSSSSSASSQFPQPHGSYGQPPPSQQQQQYAPPTNYNSPHLSQQHQQQYGQHQHQPQQQYGQPQQPYGQPQVGAFLQGAATQLMMDPNAWQSIGAGAFDQGKDLLDKNMNKWINLPVWKYYWTVDNMYVLKKIGLILFPFRHSTWNRLSTRSEVNGQHEAYKEPRYDLNAPDLYIPVMSFLTYILLVGFQSGTESKFKPEVLTITASTAMFCTLCEVIYLRLGIYLLNVNMQDNHIALADLLSYSSYKFVSIIMLQLLKMIVKDTWINLGAHMYAFIALGWFCLRSLRYILFSSTDQSINSMANQKSSGLKKTRVYFLFTFVVLQIGFSWLLIK